MKKTWPLTAIALVVAIVCAATAYLALRLSVSRHEAQIAALTVASNCQTDVIAPFLQRYHLGHIEPAPSQSFSDFVAAQVRAGTVPDSAAKELLAEIATVGQGEPVHTARSWVMPIIARGN